MRDTRRVARELALLALFQADVGKHPQEEIIEGALDLMRHNVDNALSEIVEDAREAVNEIVEVHLIEHGRHDIRKIRAAARAVILEVEGLVDRAATRTRAVIRVVPTETMETARLAIWFDGRETRRKLHTMPERSPVDPKLVRELSAAGCERIARILRLFARLMWPAAETAPLLVSLIKGVQGSHRAIDKAIRSLSEGWDLERQPAVDRNILRLGAYEVMYAPEISAGITINEAIELANRYSTDESSRFINGVLGALTKARRGTEPDAVPSVISDENAISAPNMLFFEQDEDPEAI